MLNPMKVSVYLMATGVTIWILYSMFDINTPSGFVFGIFTILFIWFWVRIGIMRVIKMEKED